MSGEIKPEKIDLALDRPVLTTQFLPRRIGNTAAGVGTEMWSADYRTRLPVDDPVRVAAESGGEIEINGSPEAVAGLQILHEVALEEFTIE